MSYLFSIDKQSKKVLHPDCVKLCPELGVLDEDELVTIILAYDNYSPFNQFPEEDKQRKAILHVYGSKAESGFFKKEKIKVAVDCYKSLQYNKKQEMINLYYTKIDDLNKEISKTKDESIINNSLKSVRDLKKYIKELEQEVLADEIKAGVVVGNSEIGLLETMLQNRTFYQSVTKKR